MASAVSGLHHVTAISGAPQPNVDFYVGLLGLRLVKKTVNFDDPGTYHLYYGDPDGSPGSVLTFFPFDRAAAGRTGAGMAGQTSFAVEPGSLEQWQLRFSDAASSQRHGRFSFGSIHEMHGERRLPFQDPDGLPLALVEKESGHAFGHFHAVRLHSIDPDGTARILTDVLGYDHLSEQGGSQRFAAPGGQTFVDIERSAPIPRPGAGTIHHVAFRAASDEHQAALQDAVREADIPVTQVKDRNYFRSIYFREPGGILFEIATDPPGFAIDETPSTLGTALKLPEWLESRRDRIEASLPSLHVPAKAAG